MQTVVAATPRAIIRYLEMRNIDAPPLHARRYEFDDVVALWVEAQERASDPDIGTAVAALVPFGGFGAPEHLMVTSPTLGSALQRLVRFYPLVNQALELSLSETRLELFRRAGGEILPCYADFVLASVRRRIEIALGRPCDEIARQAARDRVPALVFARGLLEERLPAADEELCETIESVAIDRISTAPTSTDIVRHILAARPSHGLQGVACRLGMSGRTLQRRLVAEGTTFRAVADDVRRVAAVRLLARGAAIKQVTYAVGFEEVRSFHRAFRRWTGTTPELWREKSI